MKRILAAALMVPIVLSGCMVYEYETVRHIPAREPVAPERVLALVQARTHESAMLADIRVNGVLRRPTTDEIVALKTAGASDELLRELLTAEVTTPRPAEVIRTVHYDHQVDGGVLFGLGALAGWALGSHHHYHHRHYRGCGHW